jgi:hypothetical protein
LTLPQQVIWLDIETQTGVGKMQVYGSLMNRIAEVSAHPKPEIGMGATITCYTDRHAATIIAMTAKSVTVQEDSAVRTDSNGMCDSQTYAYYPNKGGKVSIFRKRKNGTWRNTDHNGLVIGERDHYHDFDF